MEINVDKPKIITILKRQKPLFYKKLRIKNYDNNSDTQKITNKRRLVHQEKLD